VCDACWNAVARWSPPWCACCGQPQSPWRAAAAVCPRCRRIAGALPVRVVGPYEGRLRDVLHAFKYDGRRSLAPTLAGLMQAQAADVLAADYVARGELKLILQDYTVPGPVMSIVYPSAGHQSAKVRVFSDFAADLMRRWNEVVAGWLSGVMVPPKDSLLRLPRR
jgi:DNA-binding transcriptional LysR family regulator